MNISLKKTALLAGYIVVMLFVPPQPPRLTGLATGDRAFHWPLSLPRGLSGTLGEIRRRSLHMGLDCKTRGLTGLPVTASDDGRVSRLISGEGGYGNALFMEHRGGISTVYAHLESFEDSRLPLNRLARFARMLCMPDPVDLRFTGAGLLIKKGEVLGYSGESGWGLPHLHYEIRGGRGFLNPLRFHRVPDRESPVIEAVYLCTDREGSTVTERRLEATGRRNVYRLEENPLLFTDSGRPFVKVSCYDRISAANSVGVYRIRLLENNEPVYELAFDEIGYGEFEEGSRVYDISKSGIDGRPGYTYTLRTDGAGPSWIRAKDRGYLTPGKEYTLEVSDFAGNRALLDFSVKAASVPPPAIPLVRVRAGKHLRVTDASGRFVISLPAAALDRDLLVRIENAGTGFLENLPQRHPLRSGRADVLSAWQVSPADMVYRTPVTVYLPVPASRPAEPGKCMVYRYFPGKNPAPLVTSYDRLTGRYSAETRTNGYFLLIRDREGPLFSLPPAHELYGRKGGRGVIRVRAYDTLSRLNVKSIRCFLDGLERRVYYDHDRQWLEIPYYESAADPGFHQLTVFAKDYAGNSGVFRMLAVFR